MILFITKDRHSGLVELLGEQYLNPDGTFTHPLSESLFITLSVTSKYIARVLKRGLRQPVIPSINIDKLTKGLRSEEIIRNELDISAKDDSFRFYKMWMHPGVLVVIINNMPKVVPDGMVACFLLDLLHDYEVMYSEKFGDNPVGGEDMKDFNNMLKKEIIKIYLNSNSTERSYIDYYGPNDKET